MSYKAMFRKIKIFRLVKEFASKIYKEKITKNELKPAKTFRKQNSDL